MYDIIESNTLGMSPVLDFCYLQLSSLKVVSFCSMKFCESNEFIDYCIHDNIHVQ